MEEVHWQALEREHREGDVPWYWIFGALSVIVSLVSLVQGNFFFVVFIVLAAGMFAFFHRNSSRIVAFAVEDGGVRAGDVTLKYDALEHFSVRERSDGRVELVLKKKSGFPLHVHIPVPGEVVSRAIVALESRLPRVPHEESLTDLVGEWMGL